MEKKSTFLDNTYSLVKGLHHVNIAKQYFEDARFDTNMDIKAIFNQYIIKCDWILNNIKDRLNPENKEFLKTELKDSLYFDFISENLIHLNESQRELIEETIKAMVKGQEVKIIETKTEDVC
jgi:flagellin-specific chaperone FliS